MNTVSGTRHREREALNTEVQRDGHGRHISDVLAARHGVAALSCVLQVAPQRRHRRDGVRCGAFQDHPLQHRAQLGLGQGRQQGLANGAAVQRFEVAGVGDVADGVAALDDLQVERHVALALAQNHCLFRLVAHLLQQR